MNTLHPHRPAVLGPSPERLQVPLPACAEQPSLSLEAEAADVTPKSLMQKRPRQLTQYVRVGQMELNLTHEYEPGWPIAMKLQPGVRYRAKAFECDSAAKRYDELPLDARELDEQGQVKTLTFYNFARDLKGKRDDADRRRLCHGHLALWTDGVMLSTSNTNEASKLKEGRVYKVVVQRLSPSN
jgi:hypothetical protein